MFFGYSALFYNYLARQAIEARDADSTSNKKTENEDNSESRKEIHAPQNEPNDSISTTQGELCLSNMTNIFKTGKEVAASNSQSNLQEQSDKQQDFNQGEERLKQKIQTKSYQAEIKREKPEQTEQLLENQNLQPEDAAEQNNNKNGSIDTPEQHKKDTQQASHKNSSTSYLEGEDLEPNEEVTSLEITMKDFQEKVQELEKEKEKVKSLENRLQNVTEEVTEKKKTSCQSVKGKRRS